MRSVQSCAVSVPVTVQDRQVVGREEGVDRLPTGWTEGHVPCALLKEASHEFHYTSTKSLSYCFVAGFG